jgi:hypothetical protein
LRLLRVRGKDVKTSGCQLSRGVWPDLGTESAIVISLICGSLTNQVYFLRPPGTFGSYPLRWSFLGPSSTHGEYPVSVVPPSHFDQVRLYRQQKPGRAPFLFG